MTAYRTDSALSEDPELPRPPRPPTPDHFPEEDNAPPPFEEVTRLRFVAHYAGLVLASMLGSLIRLGLEGLTSCEFILRNLLGSRYGQATVLTARS